MAALPAEIEAAFAKTLGVPNMRYKITSMVSMMRGGKTLEQPGLSAEGE
jgi:hypothetical protein